MAVGILFECLQTGGFGIRKAPRQTLSLAFTTLSLGLYSFDLGVNETGLETRLDLTRLDFTTLDLTTLDVTTLDLTRPLVDSGGCDLTQHASPLVWKV